MLLQALPGHRMSPFRWGHTFLSKTGEFALRREAEKEKGLLEKRVQRLEEARATEGAALSAELAAQREAVAGELSAKDNKINDLVEELGATQALLTDKEAALQEVRVNLFSALILLSCAPGAL